ncbi:SDR family NAD(P)-dependent oxidoreductase [Sphingomicrobium astaxanthinifaciens]|uniref:SDR family NAD(P)-dependent oxidoreductase n=1 Tax=Sphingomicrobium astaxanthinifaciens TaxID=1227949 RepID=UPI001FCA6D3B|nr:SDR family NAD(P)-dependent oxidoreductase [Sphingomicrobium astaxanthinifaciens]MCJ7421103.1 SDR family NAD(P)-dependent oxidoreductase [Sphingomicrobium astaxanthinifaciens]
MTRTAFITGATSGIGAAAARALAGEGWRIIGLGRRKPRLTELADELGEDFLPITGDMRDLPDLERIVRQLPAPWREVDLLLNNAGLAPPMDDFQDADLEAQLNAMHTNMDGLVALTRALLPRLIERKGAIINLSSVAGSYPYRGGAVYGATKAFLTQFGLSLRSDLAGTGVRVTAIEPGMVETEFTLVRTGGDRAASDALYADMAPLTAEDIAEAVRWCALLPPHVNINRLEVMPTNQSFAGFSVHRAS